MCVCVSVSIYIYICVCMWANSMYPPIRLFVSECIIHICVFCVCVCVPLNSKDMQYRLYPTADTRLVNNSNRTERRGSIDNIQRSDIEFSVVIKDRSRVRYQRQWESVLCVRFTLWLRDCVVVFVKTLSGDILCGETSPDTSVASRGRAHVFT